LEEIDFNRPITGDETLDNKKYRRRVGSLHPGHKAVASYAHQLRIVLYNDPNVDMVEKFKELCHIAGLDSPLYHVVVDACRQQFFIGKKLFDVKNWLKKLPWFMAFQLEAMLRNGRLNTRDLMCNLRPLVDRLHREHPDTADNVLCYFNEELEVRPPKESPVECFKRICNRRSGTHRAPLYSKFFYCHHVTITPTRFILEGPFATQSNRVVRLYEGFEENFLRVDFREEDGLHYRWGRELDATTFLNERVGGILKGGFELAGRQFEFLAYSNSALREHAVWFMRPFEHPERGWVTSDKIRASLGDFSSVLRQPSKYAARMAQAFTATDPSITIRRDEWKEIADIGDFTDGVGTISPEMRDSIWNELCASRRDHGKNAIKPDVVCDIIFCRLLFLNYVIVSNSVPGIQRSCGCR
jgi:RNA-dependent RNA polymerase